jgi:hypothetical protein
MRRIQAAVVVANLLVLIATNVAFRAWVAQRFGYLDIDMLGRSALAWPMLAMAAIAATWAGFHLQGARVVAAVLIGLLAVVVVDQAAGALRDETVGPEGVATGMLMALQCATLALGVALSRRDRGRVSP